jgi:hypothetical protein
MPRPPCDLARRRDALAVVPHLDDGGAVFAARDELDAAAARRVLGRVVEEVREDLRDADRIGLELHRRARQLDDELVSGLVDEGAARLDRVVDDGAQIDALLPQLDLVARDAREVEQVVDEPHHVPDLTLHHPARRRERRRVGVEPEDLEARAHGRERVA